MKQVLFVSLFVFYLAHADIYLHSCRGANNRLDEANRERNNGNRLCDTQNNNRGGYNVGKLNYYVTESVPISWTNQHGCGSDDVKHCEIILQAMCDPLARDGTTTQRIPTNPANCRNLNCDTDVKYGRHESYEYYQTCERTERNKGLFQASQQPNRGDATRTRQNPGGTRRGYECPEERDYYPYWRPSPWIDLAIYTKDTGRCAQLQAESQNVKERWYCNVPEEVQEIVWGNNRIGKIPISAEKCDDINTELAAKLAQQNQNQANDGNSTATTLQAAWTKVDPNGFPAPTCLKSKASRPNHLGLIGGATQWTYDWKVPTEFLAAGETQKQCVFRIRYNITEDYDASEATGNTAAGGIVPAAKNQGNTVFTNMNNVVNATHNRKSGGGNANNRPSKLQIWRKYGITDTEVKYDATENTIANVNNNNLGDNRDYLLRNNPKPDPLGKEYGGDNFRVRLQLAVNTAQYGRTFQDRSHCSYILARPTDINPAANMKLITVSGKRGNIVQTFPGHEYFFYPEELHVKQFDYVRFHWTGSNTNPNNNDGQGKKGTDRSNVCPMKDSNYAGKTEANNYFLGGEGLNSGNNVIGSIGGNYPAMTKKPPLYEPAEALCECCSPEMVQTPIAGFPQEVADSLCTGRREVQGLQDFGNMEELDDAGTTFTMAPQVAATVGCWSYVSTRNNNFSNRCQKATICVDKGDFETTAAGPGGDAIASDNGWIRIPENTLDSQQTFSFKTEPDSVGASELVTVKPWNMNLVSADSKVELGIAYEQRALWSPKVVHRTSTDGSWETLSAEFQTSTNTNGKDQTVGVVWINEGGYYRVDDEANVGAIVAIVMSGLVFITAVSFMIWWKFFRSGDSVDEYNVNGSK